MSTISASTTSTTAYKVTADTTGALVLQTGATPTTAVTIDTSQNVGVGTTTMNGKFNSTPKATYNASSTTWAESALSTAGSYGGGLSMIDGTAGYGLNVESSGGVFVIRQGTVGSSPTERMRINSSGQIIMGSNINTSAGNLLSLWSAASTLNGIYMQKSSQVEVNIGFKANSDSNFYIGTGSSTMGAYGVYLTNLATSWTSNSDERLKENLVPIENAISKVCALRSVIGNFISDQNKTPRPFLIAQDVQAVLPEAVDTQDPDKYGLSYSDIIPLLVAAIKEQQALIIQLQADVAALKGKA